MNFRELFNLVELVDLPVVVDVGSNPIDGETPYKSILESKLCKVIGFEPQDEALAQLNKLKGNNETYYPNAIGNNRVGILNIFDSSGLTSFLKPDKKAFDLFDLLRPLNKIVRKKELQLRRLDAIEGLDKIDFLKLDVQGSELEVMQSAGSLLRECSIIQVEVSFICLYENQKGFGDIDVFLRQQGFLPHHFVNIKKLPISPILLGNDVFKGVNQVVEADMVYVKDFSKLDSHDSQLLKKLAFLSFSLYGSFDLSFRIVRYLVGKGVLPSHKESELLALIREQLNVGK